MNLRRNMYRLAIVTGVLILAITTFKLSALPIVPDFSNYEVGRDRKEAFIDYFRPLIEQRNNEILETRKLLYAWLKDRENLGWWDEVKIKGLAQEYGLESFEFENELHWGTLLRRVDIVPTSLALAQAAKESAWGTSRFAQEVNNYFGQWCFEKGCGVIPANRDSGTRHEIADFESPEDSVESYIRNLNSYSAYRQFRGIRAWLRAEDMPVTGIALVGGLGNYSQRRADYVDELRSLIYYNKLSQYDFD